MSKPILTIALLGEEATAFAEVESLFPEPTMYGVTDGKRVGTYLEQKFRAYLAAKYSFIVGNSANGIDFPELMVDMKVTSIAQPQSSCPYKSASQKIFGLGYSLLVFAYDKRDDHNLKSGILDIRHTVFVDKSRTADFQMTRGLREILDRDANEDDLIAYMLDKGLQIDSIEAKRLAQELLSGKEMNQGYLTISNALQWRLQYARVITRAGEIDGILKLR